MCLVGWMQGDLKYPKGVQNGQPNDPSLERVHPFLPLISSSTQALCKIISYHLSAFCKVALQRSQGNKSGTYNLSPEVQ